MVASAITEGGQGNFLYGVFFDQTGGDHDDALEGPKTEDVWEVAPGG